MSTYYNQKFTSPKDLYAEIKEDLRSYFEASLVDDMMFPRWTEQCLDRFRMSRYKISDTIIEVNNFKGCLPEDFISVREAWLCTVEYSDPIPNTYVKYYQRDCRISDYKENGCSPCFGLDDECETKYMVTHKQTSQLLFKFERTFLLTPGNINARKHCGENCLNLYASNQSSFDIYDNNLITNFNEGVVHLLYYADNVDDNGELQIPDNFYIKEYIKSYIKYKLFCQLANSTTDETFNQLQLKKNEADAEQAQNYILAETDMKKKTVHQKIRDIGKSYNRFNKYNIR